MNLPSSEPQFARRCDLSRRLPGRPPLTRFAYWVSSQQCTIRTEKAREELGYAPVRTIEDGLAEMRADQGAAARA